MKKHLTLSILAAGIALSCPTAQAQWYVGATAGESKAKLNDDSLPSQFLALGFTSASTAVDKTDTAYRVFGGYKLNSYFAVEGGYTDLGRFGIRTTVTPAGTFDTRVKATGFDVSGIAMVPVTDAATVFARVGAFNAETKTSFNSTGSVIIFTGLQDEKKRKTTAVYAVGATFDLSKQFALRAEASRMQKVGQDFSGNEISVNFYSAGLVYRF